MKREWMVDIAGTSNSGTPDFIPDMIQIRRVTIVGQEHTIKPEEYLEQLRRMKKAIEYFIEFSEGDKVRK